MPRSPLDSRQQSTMDDQMEENIEDQLLGNQSLEVKKRVPWYTFIGDFFNILKAFIGTNYQGLPFAFKNSGLAIGIGGVFVIACLTDYCCQLLITCKHMVIDRVLADHTHQELTEAERTKLRSSLNNSVGYGDLARRAFTGRLGNFMYHVVQIAVWFTQYLTCVAYFIFIGNTIFEMYPLIPAFIPASNITPPVAVETSPAFGVPILAMANLGRPRRSLMDDDFLGVDPMMYARNESASMLEDLAEMASVLYSDALALNNASATATAPGNTTTTAPANTTTMLPTPGTLKASSAPDLRILVLFPLAFFLVTSFIRRLRTIAPFSVIASVALAVGAVSVFAFLCHDFSIAASGFEWVKFSTLPLFVGQLISAYEGIGCIVPIESSMEGNQHMFRRFLHANVFIVFVVLTAFGSVGYLRYGDDVNQLVVRSMPQHTMLSLLVDVALLISVLFTYPLQCFPVIEIVENYLFAPGACLGPPALEAPGFVGRHIQADDDEDVLDEEEIMTNSLEMSIASVVTMVPRKVASWKRNIVRVLLTLSILGVAIVARDQYAYLAAFSGALACSLLAYILPCVIHLQLSARTARMPVIILHVIIICLACLASVFTLTVIFYKMATNQVVL